MSLREPMPNSRKDTKRQRRKGGNAGLVVSALSGLALSLGCQPTVQPTNPPFHGPTISLSQLIADVNANNAHLPTLRSSLYFEGTLIDDQGHSHFVNSNGVVLYRRAEELRLVASKLSTGDVFDLGSNGQTYWLKSPQLDTMYWGRFANIGRACVRTIPIRPDLILDVLGVGPIDDDLLKKPFPIMRFNNDARAYMVDWVAPAPEGDRYFVQKEVWYDVETKHPGLVLLYDPAGRVVLRAKLSDFKPVATDDASSQTAPMVATVYQLYFPDSLSKMSFTLHEPALSADGAPNNVSFHMPEPRSAGVGHVIQIDADCDAPGANQTSSVHWHNPNE
jgi:hypothetical protein